MKRLLIVSALLIAVMVLLAPAVLAQGPTPPRSSDDCSTWQPGGRMGSMMGRGGMMMGHQAGLPDAVAELLGLSAEEIEEMRQDGRSLAEIAEAQGVEKDVLVAAILKARTDALGALVEDEKLTQAQADLMIERMEEQIAEMVDRTETGPMWQDDRDDAGPMWQDDRDDAGPMWRNERPGQGGMRDGMRGRGGMRGQRGGMRDSQPNNDAPMRFQSF